MEVSPPNWFVALSVAIDRPLEAAPPRVTVLDPRDHHVTVAFLGAVGESAALDGWHATTIALAPTRVTLGEILALGSPRRPSAITVHLDDRALQQAIRACRDAITDAAGARRDDREALPHVTIARISPRASRSERDAALDWAHELGLSGRYTRIDRIALYTRASERGPRRYRIALERPL
jgi:2'-5' RNA ligase